MYEIYEELLKSKGVTTADVCKATGIRQSTISNWKSRRNTISAKYAKKIADYFGVSVDYLLTGNKVERKSISQKKYRFDDKSAELAQKMYTDGKLFEMISNFEKLNDDGKNKVCGYIEDLLANAKYISEEKQKLSKSQAG